MSETAAEIFPQGPAVYMFQPTHYVVVENEKMGEWEERLAKQVGLRRAPSTEARPVNGTYCLCGSTYFSEACDCDLL